MRKILAALMLLASVAANSATVFTAQYGVQNEFPFEIWSTDGLSLDTDESDDGNDALVACNDGNEAESTNTYTDEGTRYQIVLSATEMACEYITVIIDEAVDTVFYIETVGFGGRNVDFITDQGTAQSVTSTTIVLRSAAAFANDELIGQTVHITSASTGAGQSRVITDYVSSTDTATVDAWTVTPTGTITYQIAATPPNNFSTAASQIDELYDDLTEDNGGTRRFTSTALAQGPSATRYLRTGSATALGSTTSFVDSAITESVDDALNNYFIRWTSGANTGHTSRICDHAASTDGVTLCEALPNVVASGVTYELYVDAESMLAATTHTGATVPTVTDVTNEVDADIQKVNGTEVDGSGSEEDPWGPAD